MAQEKREKKRKESDKMTLEQNEGVRAEATVDAREEENQEQAT